MKHLLVQICSIRRDLSLLFIPFRANNVNDLRIRFQQTSSTTIPDDDSVTTLCFHIIHLSWIFGGSLCVPIVSFRRTLNVREWYQFSCSALLFDVFVSYLVLASYISLDAGV